MVTIKSKKEIELMRESCKVVALVHKAIEEAIKPGITTKELNDLVHNYIVNQDAYPSCLGYNGYPASICVSVNEEVVHGIPKKNRILNISMLCLFLWR